FRLPCNPIPAVGRGNCTAHGHDECSEPKEIDERPDLEPDAPLTCTQLITQCHEHIAAVMHLDGCLCGHLALYPVLPLLRIHDRGGHTMSGHYYCAFHTVVVGSFNGLDAIQAKLVVAHDCPLAPSERHIAFKRKRLDGCH